MVIQIQKLKWETVEQVEQSLRFDEFLLVWYNNN